MKSTARFKFNNGNLALLCSRCSIILKTGTEFTKEDYQAYIGKKHLPPQYCNKCMPNSLQK